jgi:hypothetical protein
VPGPRFRVATARLLAQAAASAASLADPAAADAAAGLGAVGVPAVPLRFALDDAAEALRRALGAQEDATAALQRCAADEAARAEEGFLWVRRYNARARLARRLPEGGAAGLPGSRIARPRARGVETELHAILALIASIPDPGPAGDPAFVAEGRALLAALAAARADGDHARRARQRATAQAAEDRAALVALLQRLEAADRAAALELGRPPAFPLRLLGS